MTTLTPDQAILIRNIVIVLAVFLVWASGILVAANLYARRGMSSVTGAFMGFFLGPLGVIIAALQSPVGDDSRLTPEARLQRDLMTASAVSAAPSSVLKGGTVLSDASALPTADSPLTPDANQPSVSDAARLIRADPDLAHALRSTDAGLSGSPDVAANLDNQTELLKKLIIYQAAQTDYLRRINSVAQYFFWVSVIGGVLALASFICGNMY